MSPSSHLRARLAFALGLTVVSGCGSSRPNNDAPRRAGGITVPSTCNGREFRGQTTLDLDVRSVRIRGAITVNGAPIADGTDRGVLRFADRETSATATFLLGDTGSSYAITLPPAAHYDVVYHRTSPCNSAALTTMPCGDVLLASDLDLTSAGTHDFAMRTARVQGRMTFNGMQRDASQAHVLFVHTPENGMVEPTSALVTNMDHYETVVGVGQYTVGYAAPTTVLAPALPAGNGPVRTTQDISADATVDVDVPSALLNWDLTIDGSAPAVTTAVRMKFALEGGAIAETPIFPGTNSTVLMPGRYTVTLMRLPIAPCNPTEPLPCSSSILTTNFDLRADRTETFALRTARIRGAVTVNGTEPPASTRPRRGNLVFRTTTAGANPTDLPTLDTVSVASTGPATFDTRLPVGTYDILWVPDLDCDPTLALPCAAATVATGVDAMADTMRTIDITTAPLQIELQRLGTQLPDSMQRGSVQLVSADGSGVGMVSLPNTGPSTLTIPVVRGHYRVSYVSGRAPECESIACGGALLRDDLAVDGMATVQLNLEIAQLATRLTMNGSPWTITPNPRAAVTFFDLTSATVSSVDPAPAFPHVVGAGRYAVVYSSGESLCDANTPAENLCAPEIVVGCR